MKKILLHIFYLLFLSIYTSAYGDVVVNNYSTSSFYKSYIENTFGLENNIFAPQGETPTFDNLINNATVCYGTSFTFDATVNNYTLSDDKYVWNVNGATGPTLTIPDAGNYNVTITLPDGTQHVEPVVLYTDKFTLLLPSLVQECSNNEFIIEPYVSGMDESDLNFQWFLDGSIISGATSKNYTATKPGGKYTLKVISTKTYDAGSACEQEESVDVTFPDPPNVDLGDDQEICSDESTILSISGNTEDIAWYKNGQKITGESGKTLTVTEAGIYSVTAWANGGCDFSDEIEIKVIEKPIFWINQEQEICNTSGNATLNIVFTEKPGYTYSYSWSNGDTGKSTTVNSSGTYSATITVNGGCPKTEYVDVYPEISNYEIDVVNSSPICEGDIIKLDATAYTTDASGNKLEAPGATYKWTKDGAGFSGDRNAKLNLSLASQSGHYKVVVTTNSCSYTDELDIEIVKKPDFDIDNDKQLCGGSTSINTTFTPVAGLTYIYELNGVVQANPPPYNVTSSGYYKIKITVDGTTCSDEKTIHIYGNQLLSISKQNDGVCDGEGSVKLSALLGPDNVTGIRSYEWKNSLGVTVGTGSSINISNYDDSGIYTLHLELNGCSYDASTTVTVKPKADFTVDNDELCGNKITVPVTVDKIISGKQYRYDLGGDRNETKLISDGSLATFDLPAGKYTMDVYIDNSCPTSKKFEIFPKPTATIDDSYYPRCINDGGYFRLKANENSIYDATKYVWRKDGVIVYGDSQRIKPNTLAESGSYTVTITLSNGCEITSAPVDVVINPNPTFSLTPEVICDGNPVTLEPENLTPADNGSFTYRWTRNGSFYSNNKQISTSQNGTYCLTVETDKGCPETQCVDVIEEILDIIPQPCEPGSLTARVTELPSGDITTGHTYYWTTDDYWPSGTNAGSGASIGVPADGLPHTYFLVVKTTNGCTLKDTETITVVPDFDITLDIDATQCYDFSGGNTQTITATGNNIPTDANYTWTGPGIVSQSGNTITINEGGTYRVVVRLNGVPDQCIDNVESVTISEYDADFCIWNDVTNDCTTPPTQCGGSIEIGYNLGNGANYTWYKDGSPYPENTPLIDVTESGTYRLEATQGACNYSDEIIITITQQPSISISQSGDLCNGSVLLTADVTNGTGTVIWYEGDKTNQVYTGLTFSATTDGKYIAYIENAPGCSDEASVTIDPAKQPIFDHIDDFTVCEGDNININVSMLASSITNTWWGFHYELYGPNNLTTLVSSSLQSGAGRNYTFSLNNLQLSQSGTYKVIAYYNGCSYEQEFEIDVNVIPVVDLEGDKILCNGGAITLDADSNNLYPSPPATFLWSNGRTTKTITVNSAGTYSVEINNNNCSADDEIIIYQTGDGTDLLGGTAEICEGETYNLDATLNISGVTYTWQTPDPINNGSTSPNITISEAGDYKVIIHDPNTGCDYEETFTLIINIVDAPLVDDVVTHCVGETLYITPGNVITSATYKWYRLKTDGSWTLRHKGDTFEFVPKDWKYGKLYKVVVEYKGCTNEKTFRITKGTLPNFELNEDIISCLGYEIKIEPFDAVANTYEWYEDGKLLADSTNMSSIKIYGKGGNYSVTAINNIDGCDLTKDIDLDNLYPSNLILPDTVYLCNNNPEYIDFSITEGKLYWVKGTLITEAEAKDYKISNIGEYWFKIKTNDDCFIYDTVYAKVDILDISMPDSRGACIDEVIQLEVNGDVAYQYEWFVNGVLQNNDKSTFDFKIKEQVDSIIVNAWTEHGCMSADTTVVSPTEMPAIELFDAEICDGESVILNAKPNNPDVTVTSYVWFYDGEMIASGADASTYEATKDGDYNVVINTTQCSYNDKINLKVFPTPYFDFGDDITGCLSKRPQLEVVLDTKINWDIDSYKWYYDEFDDGNFIEMTGVTGSKFTVIDKGTYYAEVITLDGCTDSSMVKVDYKLEPTFDLGQDIAGCTIARPKLEVNITNPDLDQTSEIKSYEWWYKAEGSTDYTKEDSTKLHYSVVKDGMFKAVVETLDGCIFEDSVKVDYQPKPIVNLVIPNLDCEQQRPVLMADVENIDDLTTQNEEIKYTWYFEGTVVKDSIKPHLTIIKDGKYTVEVSTETCMGSDESQINYIAKPIVSLSTDDLQCLASSPVIKSTIENISDLKTQGDNISYEWWYKINITATDSTIVAGESNSELTTNIEGAYTIVVSTDNCSTATSIEIEFSSEPTFDLGQDIAGCTIARPKLEVNITNPDLDQTSEIKSYEWWYKAEGSSDYTKEDSTKSHYFVVKDGMFKVVVETLDGCIFEDSVKVDYQPKPIVNLVIPNLDCEQQRPVLMADVVNIDDLTSQNEEVKYTWYFEGTVVKDSIKPHLTIIKDGKYTVEVSTETCMGSDESQINYIAKPIVSLSTDDLQCLASSPVIKSSIENISDLETQGDNISYEWWYKTNITATDSTIVAGENDSELITNIEGAYTVVVSTDNCSTATSIEIEFSSEPTFDLGQDIAGCTIARPKLEVNITNPDLDQTSEIKSYEWWYKAEGSTDYTKEDSTKSHYFVAKDGMFKAVVETLDGCIFEDSVKVDYNPEPVVKLDLSYDESECQEVSGYINITLDNVEDFEEGLKYYWTRPILKDTVTTVPELKIHSKGQYTVNVKTINGCESGEQSITIAYKPKPEITAIPKWDQNGCQNTDSYIEVSLDNASENFAGNITYLWERPILADTTTTEPRLLVRSGGNYTVQALVEGGCSSDVIEIPVEFYPTPVISLQVEGDTATCTLDPVLLKVKVSNSDMNFGNLKFLWTRPEASDTTTTIPELLVHTKGKYTVKVITGFDCESIPASKEIDYRPIPRIEANPNWNQVDCIAEDGDAGYITVDIVNKSDCKEEDIKYIWTLPDLSTTETNVPRLKVHSSGKYFVEAITDEGCFSEKKDIDINDYKPEPSFTLAGAETCEIDTQILEANISGMNLDINTDELTYSWSNGISGKGEDFRMIEVSNSEDITTDKTVKYSVTVTTENGCDITKEAFVTFTPSPVFDLGDDIEMCDIDSRKLTVGDIKYDNIIWSTGDKTKSINVYKAGEYWVEAELGGCTYSDTVLVETVSFPKFNVEVTNINCEDKIITLGVITDDSNLEFLWSTDEKEKSIDITEGGDYSIVVRKKGNNETIGCSIVKNINIKDQFFNDFSAEEDVAVCAGEKATLKPDHEFETIKWSTGETTASIEVSEEGTYEAITTNEYFCNNTVTYYVTVDEGPKVTKIEVTEGTMIFDFEGGVAPFTYTIDDEEVYSKNIVNDFTEGTHILYISDVNGCNCSEEFEVKDPISISDVISPNDDGFNDRWEIDDLKRYPRSRVRIYDRYGRLMHESPGVSLSWDGRFKGKNVPATDYWYHIDMFGDGRLVYTGHFALIR